MKYDFRRLNLGKHVACTRARICKRLRSPGIVSKESIPPASLARRAGTSNRVVVLARQAGYRLLGSLKVLQIRALYTTVVEGGESERNNTYRGISSLPPAVFHTQPPPPPPTHSYRWVFTLFPDLKPIILRLTQVLRVFLLGIHSHLCSFALRFLFIQSHATSYSF
jgi:hypothetical protein